MENETNQNNSAPTQPAAQNPAPATPQTKKTSPWVWVISGCLIIVVLTMGVIGFLGWWGYHKAKDEIKKQQPNFEQFKGDLEEAAKEAEKWEKEAQDLQNNMPNPEDFNYPMPDSGEEPVLN